MHWYPIQIMYSLRVQKPVFMLRNLTILAFALFVFINVNAQLNVGDTSRPQRGAILELSAGGNKGLLGPRVTLASLTKYKPVIGVATEGMLVYNNGLGGVPEKGYYFWNGTSWGTLGSTSVQSVDFTIPTDSIKLNPYGFTPLSALINFKSSRSGKTYIKVHGKHGSITDVEHTFHDTGTNHSIPIIGMYASYANTVDIRILNANGDTLEKNTITITTPALPPNMPTSISYTPFDETQAEPGLTMVSNFSTYGIRSPQSIPYFLDDYGEIRWVLDYASSPELESLFYDDGISRLRNGNFYFGNSSTNKIYEVGLLGNIINSWAMPGKTFHHEVLEKPNGNFLFTSTYNFDVYPTGGSVIEDIVIEINRQTGAFEHIWNMKEILDYNRRAWGRLGEKDWFHGNAVLYDSTDNTIIVSGRQQGIIKVDYNDNVKWILAPHKGWNTDPDGLDLTQFLLNPLHSDGSPITDTMVIQGYDRALDFEWTYYQHSPIFLPNGNLMVFDNGTNRQMDTLDGNNVPARTGKYSRAVEYQINATNKTIKQVWEYGKERGESTFSSIVSSVQWLKDKNHVLFGPGYNVANGSGGNGGAIVEVDYATHQVIDERRPIAANTWGFHRAKKMSAYPPDL